VFVPGKVVRRVVEVVPFAQRRLLVGLARWLVLRIPSEALALTWADVDFANRRFVARAAKTEHLKDGGVRLVPMFQELAPLFQAVFDEATEGAAHVITRYPAAAVNLRTRLQRHIDKAGDRPWPKPVAKSSIFEPRVPSKWRTCIPPTFAPPGSATTNASPTPSIAQ